MKNIAQIQSIKLKKGDNVVVVRGKEAGKTGKILQVIAKEAKVLVENLNAFKRHTKGRMQGQTSEIKIIYKPLPVANVALLCPACKEKTRIGYKLEGKEKTRICRKCLKQV